jgi:Tfp pilus assembly PilM family ATPase
MAYRKRQLLPIGIHLNADAVHMVQLEQGESGVSLVSTASQKFASVSAPARQHRGKAADLPDEVASLTDDSLYDQAREFVREKITTDGFRGRDAVLSLPAEYLVIQHVRLAPLAPEELPSVLPGELQGKLPFDPRKAVLRHIVAGQVSENGETKQDVIVLAVRRDAIEKFVSTVSRLGLHVVGIGVEPCCMCYPYTFAATRTAVPADGASAQMLVYLGPRATHVGIVRGADTTFVKGVELGTDHLVEALAGARNTTAPEIATLRAKWKDGADAETLEQALAAYNSIQWQLGHIVDEIESCLRYHTSLARGARIDRVVFLGPEARDRALVRVLGAHLNIACDTGSPLEAATGTATTDGGPEMAVAIGLSLFGAQ